MTAEIGSVAQAHATPRRTLLMEGSSTPVTAAVPLEVHDEPCVILLSSTELLARTADTTPAGTDSHGQRSAHDVIVSAIPATTRGEFGLVTSAGRVLRLNAVDLPAIPAVSGVPALSAGAPLGILVDLPPDEPLALTTLDEAGGLALATARGVVKRVIADVLQSRDSWEVIRLDDGDRVVGAARLTEADAEACELVFISSDAQLLRIPAGSDATPGAGGVGDGRHEAGQGRRGHLLPGPPSHGSRRGGHDRGQRRCPARHGCGDGEGDPSGRVPGQGPGDRRRAVPQVPVRRGPPAARLGRHRARAGGHRVRCAGCPARDRPPPRCHRVACGRTIAGLAGSL